MAESVNKWIRTQCSGLNDIRGKHVVVVPDRCVGVGVCACMHDFIYLVVIDCEYLREFGLSPFKKKKFTETAALCI